MDNVSFGEDYRAFDRILELTHVTRPSIVDQQCIAPLEKRIVERESGFSYLRRK